MYSLFFPCHFTSLGSVSREEICPFPDGAPLREAEFVGDMQKFRLVACGPQHSGKDTDPGGIADGRGIVKVEENYPRSFPPAS